MPDAPILIAGGGIGGLAAAIGLAQKGFSSVVLEKSRDFSEVGAGIQLGPNAFHAFDYLGVGDAARRMAVYIDHLRLMDAMSGQEITGIPLDDAFRSRFGNPYAVVHRGDLYAVLLQACQDSPMIALQSGTEVLDYDQDKAGVTATLVDGTTRKGLALIGADGLWSAVRARVIGDGPPRVSGHSTYRSVIPVEDMPEDLRWNAATLWAGPKCHIVHYPLSGWKAFNLVVTYHNDAPESVAGQPVTRAEVQKGFDHVAPIARQIIDKGRDWRLWVLCDRDPAPNWVDGAVALLGDAAHPQLQYFAQGACMALEDAVALSHHFEINGAQVGAALQGYQEMRRLRTARIQLQSREIGNHIYHAEGVHAELRNAIMRAKSPQDWYDTIDWLYGSTGLVNAVSAGTASSGTSVRGADQKN